MSLGRDQRIRLKSTLFATFGGVLLTIALIYASLQGLTVLQGNILGVVLSLFWAINLVIIAAIYFGWSMRCHDPSLSLAQMYWAASTSIFAFASSWSLDTLFVLFILLPMVFGIFRVSATQFNYYCIYSSGLFLAAIVCRQKFLNSGEPFANEIIIWVSFSGCAFILASMCKAVVKLRTRLKEKNHALGEALEAKRDFLTNMSHEIRTPMHGIIGMLSVILLDENDAHKRQRLKIAQTSANALVTIINDILDITNIESGKLVLNPSAFNLPEMILELIAGFSASANEKSLRLSFERKSDVPDFIVADPSRIRQVLANLIGNAIKFTEKGGVKVRVSLVEQSEKDLVLEFDVEDTGIGIDIDKASGMFEPFTQADQSSTRTYGGTGLGLAIARQLCELMGGNIQFSPSLEKGSRFHFTISAQLSENTQKSTSTDLSENGNCFTGKKILLAEDGETNQEVVLLFMESYKIEVDVANDGGETLEKLEKSLANNTLYDMILMDCQMPVLDGYQTTQIIRSDPSLSAYENVPIVALTAHALAGDRERCLSSGMTDYVSKPFDIDTMEKTLEKWLLGETGEALGQGKRKLPEMPENKRSLVWNYSALLTAVGGKQKRAYKLANNFQSKLPAMSEKIKDSVRSRDVEAVLQSGHALKGSAANLRAEQLSQMASNLEIAARQRDWDKMDETLPVLVNLVCQTQEAIQNQLSMEKS